jgi:hypothetical protein
MPWKHGFKPMTLTDQQAVSFCHEIQRARVPGPSPEVPHPRRDEAEKEVLGRQKKRSLRGRIWR